MSRAAERFAAALALVAGIAGAQDSDSIIQRLRPTGPVEITAQSADWTKGGAMVYTGNVRLRSDTLDLEGDRLELRQVAGGQFEARITGDPAHLRHDGEINEQGERAPPVTARARTLVYDSRSGLVELAGAARLTRGADEITGETIRYNVSERRIQAAGGSGGQVRIVIQPPPQEGAAEPSGEAPPRETPGRDPGRGAALPQAPDTVAAAATADG